VNLKQVTLEEMLDAMLNPIGLTSRREGGVIRVERPRVQTRVFTVNYIASQRSGNAGLSSTAGASGAGGSSAGGGAGGATGGGATGGGSSSGGSTSSVGSTDTFDLWGELEGTLTTFLSENGRLVMSPTAGLVAVTDLPENVMQVARYLDLVQGSVQRQVMIEAQILEVTLDDTSRTGVDWSQIPYQLSLPGLGATTGSLGGGAILTQAAGGAAAGVLNLGLAAQNGLRLLVSALESQGDVSILSSPKVSTLNNQKAIIKVATDDVFFTRTTQREPLTGVVTETVTPNTITEGLVLDVTPQIGEDAITMNIRPSISERLGERTSSTGDTVPILAVRASDTVVRVRDGETVVIGGLMHTRQSRTRSGVPGLQRAPLVGRAFRSETVEADKIELVILLTPTVLVGRGDAELTPRELQLLREAGAAISRR
jgi:MSHA type pilus biogenesis protein MshL